MKIVILLRGINVGSTRSLPMNELVEILEELGLIHVQTYIQSGNIVAERSGRPASDLTNEIGRAIEDRKGFKPQVLVLTVGELERAMKNNPFPEAESEPNRLHLFFLSSKPGSPDTESLEQAKIDSERYHLDDRVFYLHAPDGFGRSKLAANVEKYLGVPVTARNWRTVLKLREMSG